MCVCVICIGFLHCEQYDTIFGDMYITARCKYSRTTLARTPMGQQYVCVCVCVAYIFSVGTCMSIAVCMYVCMCVCVRVCVHVCVLHSARDLIWVVTEN